MPARRGSRGGNGDPPKKWGRELPEVPEGNQKCGRKNRRGSIKEEGGKEKIPQRENKKLWRGFAH